MERRESWTLCWTPRHSSAADWKLDAAVPCQVSARLARSCMSASTFAAISSDLVCADEAVASTRSESTWNRDMGPPRGQGPPGRTARGAARRTAGRIHGDDRRGLHAGAQEGDAEPARPVW